VPTPRRSVMRQDEPWRIALHALTEIPLAVPEGAAERIIRRALRRAGRPGDTTTTRAALARLRENNLVRIEAGAMQPRVVVTDEGRTLLTAGYPG
jgi:hypothetical protein